MSFFHHLKLRVKLLALIGFMVLAMAGLGIYNVQIAGRLAQGGEDIFKQNLLGVEYALRTAESFQSFATALNQHINARTGAEFEVAEKAITEARQEIAANLKQYEQAITLEKEQALVAAIRTGLEEYYQPVSTLLSLNRAGKVQEALAVAAEMRSSRKAITENLNALVKLNHEEAEKQYKKNHDLAATSRTNALVAIVAVAILSVLVGLWVASLIVNPVREVQAVAEALAEGDLGRRARIKSRDEVGVMAAAINRAVENLRVLVTQVANTSEQVAASSEELASSAQQVGQVTQQVAETISQLAKGSDEQARAAQETGRVVENMSASIEQVAASAQQMSKDATGAATTAEEGRKAVDQAISQMETIRKTVDESAVAVKGLGERSQEIGRIVEVITSIADQTNLLALNAAIEAARAGEQGRGFAVVAEEVRKLAEQSREAAEQISSLIREIQGETAKAVSTMEAGTKEVAAGTEVVSKSGRAFAAIAEAVQTVVAQIQEVSAATQQLATGSEQVVKSVESIAAITEEAAAGTEEVSASSEEQSASVEEIAASAESLAQLAQELQKAVAQFKL
ncbi:MAG: HAMP domain-containing methyl-accepting chemotaxis protein [Bacillota bacterium]|nr:HAMP domain-containing methyl-accepting chemotaxis protein [Bacillota bacterium]